MFPAVCSLGNTGIRFVCAGSWLFDLVVPWPNHDARRFMAVGPMTGRPSRTCTIPPMKVMAFPPNHEMAFSPTLNLRNRNRDVPIRELRCPF